MRIEKNMDWKPNESSPMEMGEKSALIDDLAVQLGFGFLYSVIFFVGLLGNFLVVLVVIRNPQMRKSVTNLFIGNLALSNALLCSLSVPFTPLYTFMGYWSFGVMSCRLLMYSLPVSVYVSSWTLTGIAVDRYLVIIHPFRQRMRVNVCLGVIIGIWLATLTVSLPYYEYANHFKAREIWVCEENWPSESFRQIFNTMTAVLQFVIPFLIIALCYTCVSRKLSDRARPGNRNVNDEERARKRTQKTVKMLVSMVVVFLILWLPLYAVNFLEDAHMVSSDQPYFHVMFLFIHAIAMTSSCCNPFLYAWLNENFREEFRLVLPCYSRTSRNNSPQNATSQRLCNGRQTLQESLLPTPATKQTSSRYEVILLDQTTNIREQDEEFPTADETPHLP